MEVQLFESQGSGRAFIERDNRIPAEMTWISGGEDYIIIDHTRVDDSLRGTGAGRKMLDVLVIMAAERGQKIKPVCPFVVAMFRKHPEYSSISLHE